MPQLLKNITGNLSVEYSTEINYVKILTGEVQLEDYINLNGIICYLQNLTQTEYTEAMVKPLVYGLQNNHRLTVETLEISY
jgi:hypothetical protein